MAISLSLRPPFAGLLLLEICPDNEAVKGFERREKTNNMVKEPVANSGQLPEVINIQSMIRVIRDRQVMLDSDLSALYDVETRRLNEQVKRNIERFPDDFMFQLGKDELDNLCDIRLGGIRKLPYAFTEQGIAMLSSVLKSKTAVEVNIRIMRAFISMRRFIATNAQLFQRLEIIEYHQLEMKQHQRRPINA